MNAERAKRALFAALLMVAVTCLASCSGQDEKIDKAEAAVKSRLKDPESATFRNVFIGPNGITVCGEVNAKNGFGGYVGFRTFISIDDFVHIDRDSDKDTAQQWATACSMPPIAPKKNS